MLSRDVAKTTITVYNYLPGKSVFHRAVIRDCIWLQGSQANQGGHGMAIPDDVTIQISHNYKYVQAQEFDGNGWTFRMGPELEGSYIVKGECSFHAPRGVTKEDFARDVILPFEEKYGPKRPKEIHENFFGSRNMWYLDVSC